MAQNVTINGVVYAFPETGESNWGDVVTQWAVAVSSGLLQKTGGSFILTSEVDFGANFGFKSLYVKYPTGTVASAGFLRLPNNTSADGDICWRNNADTDNCFLYLDTSDDLILNQNGTPINLTTAAAGNVTGPGSSTDNAIARYDGVTGQLLQDSSVLIDDSDNITGVNDLTVDNDTTLSNLTATTVPYLDASKVMTSSAVTPTELGFLAGVVDRPVSQAATTVFTSSGTWTKATLDPVFVKVNVVGGGGGSGGAQGTSSTQASSAGGGGGGETSVSIILASGLGATETVTIGAGGTAGASGNNAGGSGGTSSFGAHVTAVGGGGGSGGGATSSAGGLVAPGGTGGTGGTGGDYHFRGGDAGNGRVLSGQLIGSNNGGHSSMAGSRRGPAGGGNGFDGYVYGGGASGSSCSGSQSSRFGAEGADGVVIVEEFY